MNHIYKTVWNEQTGTYVAVSEITKRKGKSNTVKAAVVVSSIVGALAMLSSPALAAASKGGTGSGTTISQVEWGTSQSNASNVSSVAVGNSSKADVANGGKGVSFYNRGNPDNQDFDFTTNKQQGGAYYSTAVGTNAQASGGSVALGHGSEAGIVNTDGLAVAIGAQARARNVAALAVGPAALATGNASLALGRQSSATENFAQAIGNVARADGVGALAVGHSATAQGKRSIAIGAADIDNAGNTGTQQGTVYQEGEQTLATGRDSIALGAAANATSDFALSIGAHSTASGLNSTAMGFYAEASGENSFASGASAKASGINAFALGAKSLGQGARSFAMGPESKATGENALALGSLSLANQKNSIAVGVEAKANYENSVALGSFSEVNHVNSLAIGTQSTTNDYTTEEAFLYESGAAGAIATGAVSFGNGSGTTKDGAANERRLQNVAAGGLDTDAVNVSQLKMHKGITDQTAKDIVEHLGGGSTFNDETGVINAPNYVVGDNTYNNVGDALNPSYS